MMKRQKWGGGFSAQFSGIIIFSLELYLGDQLCSNFQESLFLALNYTLGTNFVPNVLKKVLSVTRLMRYKPIKIIS